MKSTLSIHKFLNGLVYVRGTANGFLSTFCQESQTRNKPSQCIFKSPREKANNDEKLESQKVSKLKQYDVDFQLLHYGTPSINDITLSLRK